MKTYQFSVCEQVDGVWTEVPNVRTPAVTASTPVEAMNHTDVQSFMSNHPTYRFYRQVN
jgi:hypothetical protein